MIRTLLRELSKYQMKIEGRCCLLYQYLLFFFLDVRCTNNVQVNVSLIHIKSARNTYLNFIFERLQLLSAEVFVHFDCRKKFIALEMKTYALSPLTEKRWAIFHF